GGHPPVPAPQDPALPAVRLLPPQRPMARRPPGTDGDDPPGRHPVSHLRDRLPVRPRGPVTPPARPGLCHGRPRRFTTGDGHHPPTTINRGETLDTRIPATHQIGGLLRDWLASHTAQRPTPITGGVKLALEAVPTYYHGTWFRSRLEADWAATLDQYGIAWTYEPETITLPSGKTYVPDFWLPDHDTWLEVKGPGVPGLDKAHEFAATTDSLVIIGQPPT